MSKKLRERLAFVLLAIASAAFIIICNGVTTKGAVLFSAQTSEGISRNVVRVDEITGIDEKVTDLGGGTTFTTTVISYKGLILFGERFGDTISATQSYDTMTTRRPVPVEPGDVVFVYEAPPEQGGTFTGSFVRLTVLIPAFIVFLILLVVYARFKGVCSILALGFTIFSVFFVFVPAILSGRNIYFWSLMICAYSIVITPLFVGGFNKKSLSAALGCAGGVAVAAGLTAALDSLMKITGSVDDDSQMVEFILEEPIDLRAVVFASILIGALGAALDVSMSIASSVSETREMNPGIEKSELLSFGMNVGRDIIGTQISTLVLAYIGGSLSVVLLLIAYQSTLFDLLNIEMVVIELLQGLIGAFTILFTIPATALVSSLLLGERRNDAPAQTHPDGKRVYHAHPDHPQDSFRIGH